MQPTMTQELAAFIGSEPVLVGFLEHLRALLIASARANVVLHVDGGHVLPTGRIHHTEVSWRAVVVGTEGKGEGGALDKGGNVEYIRG